MVTNTTNTTKHMQQQIKRSRHAARLASDQRDDAMKAFQTEQQAHCTLRTVALEVASQAVRDDEVGCYAVPIETLDRLMWALGEGGE